MEEKDCNPCLTLYSYNRPLPLPPLPLPLPLERPLSLPPRGILTGFNPVTFSALSAASSDSALMICFGVALLLSFSCCTRFRAYPL
jgi:hypothetical protein